MILKLEWRLWMLYGVSDSSSSERSDFADEYGLVRRAQLGDKIAFEQLYERYNERINRYLTHMINDDGAAAELAQETFLKAWRALLSLRDPASFTSWLYRIATTKAYNHQKYARRLRTIPWEESIERSETPSISGPEKLIEEIELMKLVLARLSPTLRSCFILYVIEKLPREEIAHLLGIKITNVSKYINRSKMQFRHIYYLMTNDGQGKKRRK
jgi:RNA polymerase sigma-70 factor (ECF subfamily)